MVQVSLTELKNKLSGFVQAVQAGASYEITVRGIPVARLAPIPKSITKQGFYERVLSHMDSPTMPKLDIRANLLADRK